MFVCVCVCVRPQLSRAKVRQARLVLCCLDGERVVSDDNNSVLAGSGR